LMVAGADDLLDELSEGANYVTVKTTQHSQKVEVSKNEALLELISKDTNGLSGTYKVLGEYKTNLVVSCSQFCVFQSS